MQRTLTLLLTAAALLLAASASAAAAVRAPRPVNIWDGVKGMPRVKMFSYPVALPAGADSAEKGTVREGAGRRAVIVCPGGSYFWHDMETEGHAVARWLNAQGIAAFVLQYRTAEFPAYATRFRRFVRGRRYPDAQDDLRRALRLVRDSAAAWGIDTARIGVMGFSAGGHLAMSAAEFFEKAERPSFVAACYPVVSMTAVCTHRRSRRALLGESRMRNRRLRDSLSLERHVPADCPPVFLMNCEDDPVVDARNAVLLDSALTAAHVGHRYVRYATGGHGFGASDTKGTEECRRWRRAFLEWLKEQK